MAEFVMQAQAKQSDVDDKVNASRTVDNNTSVNSVVKSGFYRLSGSTPDMPSGCAYGQLIVSRGNDTVSQIAMPYAASTMYIRGGSYYNNQWSFSAWEKVALNSNIATKANWYIETESTSVSTDIERVFKVIQNVFAYLQNNQCCVIDVFYTGRGIISGTASKQQNLMNFVVTFSDKGLYHGYYASASDYKMWKATDTLVLP